VAIRATEITDTSITMAGVADKFADAVEAQRRNRRILLRKSASPIDEL